MTSPRPGSELIHCANRTLDFFRRDKNLDEDDNRIITLILVEINRDDLSLAGFIYDLNISSEVDYARRNPHELIQKTFVPYLKFHRYIK